MNRVCEILGITKPVPMSEHALFCQKNAVQRRQQKMIS